MDNYIKIDTAGLGDEERMGFDPGISHCGKIENGVSFDIGHGCWVISFEDFQKMYRAALKARRP